MRVIHDPRSVFISMGVQNIDWWQAIAELIDNSLDAGALRIEIAISSKSLEISDDGRGCGHLERMLALGSHLDQGASEQTVGMWGVGLKDAWTFCGDRIEVESVHRGTLSTAIVSVSEISPDGEVPDPVVTPTDRQQGTFIRLPLKKGRRPPQQATWDKISWVFTPAMQNQKQIVVSLGGSRRKTLQPLSLPPFSKSHQSTFEIDGKSVDINIGIVQDGHKMRNGPFWLSYGHRNIDGSSIGSCGKCTLRMGGTIALGKGWILRKNKDDLSEMEDELEQAIFQRIEQLLSEQEQLSMDIESAAILHELESMLNNSITHLRKEKRPGEGQEHGTVPPTFSGKKRQHAKHSADNPGSVNGEKNRRGLRTNWEDADNDRIGVFDPTSKEVRLNIGNPYIAKMKAIGNLAALHACSVALLCHEDTKQLLFPKYGDFSDNFGRIMSTIPTGEQQ